MLPTQLASTYRQYKQDTDSVAAWLASTAKSCGYPAPLLASKTWNVTPPQSAGTGRLKGKARKQAKGAANPAVSSKEKSYLVSLGDFIAKYKNGFIKVPDAFSKTLDRVIAVRSQFGRKMREQGAELDPESDAKHGHFVDILEDVRNVLRPCMSTVDVAKDDQDGSQDMTNRFATLSVFEPKESFASSSGSYSEERPKQQEGDNITYEADSSGLRNEAWFIFQLLMQDLAKVRSSIMWLWSNCGSPGLDLAVVGVTSNTALSIARGLIDEITPLVTKFTNGIQDPITVYYHQICLEDGFTDEECLNIGAPGYKNGAYINANDTCMIAFHTLQLFRSQIGSKSIIEHRPGKFGYYDPTSNRDAKSGEEKVDEDRTVLLEFLSDIMMIVWKIPNYPVKDEFLRGMQDLEKTKEVSLSLVFTAQVFLDIHHTIRNASREHCERALRETRMMQVYIKSYFQLHQGSKKDAKSANLKMLQELSHNLEFMNDDPVYQLKAMLYTMEGQQIPERWEAHRIMILNPILAGLSLFYFRSHMYKVGLNAANSWRSIISCAHLYNALSQKGLALGRWTDMETAINLLGGDSSFWVGVKDHAAHWNTIKSFTL